MNSVKLIILIICLGSFLNKGNAQSFFRGSLVTGLNLSQIDGDQLSGYRKFGISTGLKMEFPISSTFDLGLEFLFSQRGSRSTITPNQFVDVQRIHLNYAAMPIFIKWNDWWIEEDSYYKFNLHGGLAPGWLISSRSNLSQSVTGSEFNKFDLSFFLGTGYSFTNKWALTLRYTRALNRLFSQQTTSGEIQGLIGYFITIRSEYTF